MINEVLLAHQRFCWVMMMMVGAVLSLSHVLLEVLKLQLCGIHSCSCLSCSQDCKLEDNPLLITDMCKV